MHQLFQHISPQMLGCVPTNKLFLTRVRSTLSSKGLGHWPSVLYTRETADQASAVGLRAKWQERAAGKSKHVTRLNELSGRLLNTTPPSAAGLPHCIFVPNLRTTQALPRNRRCLTCHTSWRHNPYKQETPLSHLYHLCHIVVKQKPNKKMGTLAIKSMKRRK